MRKLIATLFLFNFFVSYGQDKNIPTTDTLSMKFTKVQMGIGGNYSSGNTEILGFSSNNSITRTNKIREWNISPSFVYAQIQQNNKFETKQRELYVTGSVQQLRGGNKLIGSVEFESSLLKLIRSRSSIGIGWSFDIIRRDKIKFVISEAALYESHLSDVIINRNLQSIRASTRLRFAYIGKVNTDIVALIQPAIWDDRNLSTKDNINMRITGTFALPINTKIQIGLTSTVIGSTYSSYINPTVKPIDILNQLTLVYKNQ